MELRHLRYFQTVAEELHFNRAAERLNISQPPLSQQIKQLELELGVELFSRTKRKVELTAPGKAFLAETRKILAHIEFAANLVKDVNSGERGSLRLGSIYSGIYTIIPRLLRRFGEEYPNVTVDIQELTISQQLERLHEGKIDAGILRMPILDPDIETRIIFHEGIVAALPANHVLAERASISLSELAQYPIILSGIGLRKNFRQQVLDLFNERDIPVSVAREVAEMHTLISLVGAGLGLALVPESVSRIQIADVVYLPLLEATPKVGVALAWHKERKIPALNRLIEVMFETEFDGVRNPVAA